MRKTLLAFAALSLAVPTAYAQNQATPAKPATAKPAAAKAAVPKKMPTAQMTASAMSAGPKSSAKGAAIVMMDDKGSMMTLRQGTTGFTCMPDTPATPGPDPMCMDANAVEWAMAWI